MSWLADIFKAFDLKPKYPFGASGLGILLLLLPRKLSDSLGVTSGITMYRGWIGFGTLACLVLGLVQSWDPISKGLTIRKRRRAIIRDIDTLSNGEFSVLVGCLERNARSYRGADHTGNATALAHRGMFEAGEDFGSKGGRVYTVPLFLWEHLRENRDRHLTRLAEIKKDPNAFR